jgi:hypothetical protein
MTTTPAVEAKTAGTGARPGRRWTWRSLLLALLAVIFLAAGLLTIGGTISLGLRAGFAQDDVIAGSIMAGMLLATGGLILKVAFKVVRRLRPGASDYGSTTGVLVAHTLPEIIDGDFGGDA